MNCVRHQTPLQEHAHGVPLSLALEAHLAGCAACQDVLAAEQQLLSEIDRALDGVGRVEPSPTFLARARGIALDPPRRSLPFARLAILRRWPVWALPALAGALLIAVLVARSILVEPRSGVASSSSKPPFATSHSPARVTAPPESRGTPLSSEPPRPTASRETAAATRRPSARSPSSEPAALVPPGQADALVRLATLIAAGSVPPPALLLEPPDPDQELRLPTALDLRPLAIEPIAREGADNEGETL